MNAHPDSDGEPPDDPAALLDRAGIDAAGLARRKAAIGLDDADAERLSALQPVLRERRSAVLDDVTDALADRHSTAGGDGRPRSERVERTWRTELTGLGAGRYDEGFARDRAAVALATSDADVQLSEYFAVHGRTYDR